MEDESTTIVHGITLVTCNNKIHAHADFQRALLNRCHEHLHRRGEISMIKTLIFLTGLGCAKTPRVPQDIVNYAKNKRSQDKRNMAKFPYLPGIKIYNHVKKHTST